MRTEAEKNRIKPKHTSSENNLQHPGNGNRHGQAAHGCLRSSLAARSIPVLNFFWGWEGKGRGSTRSRENLTGKVVRGKAGRARKNRSSLPGTAERSDPFCLSGSFQGI